MALPTEKQAPTLTVEQSKLLLYGPPKIGKTTLAAGINPDTTLFIATEPGHGALNAFVSPCPSWDEFRDLCQLLKEVDHGYKTVVIDTVDELYKQCAEAKMKELNISHPSDLEYGKGWGMVSNAFRLGIGFVSSLGMGVWLISHAKEVEIKQRVGSVTKMVPNISGNAGKFVTGFVDFILYAGSEQSEEGEQRFLHTTATENYEAGGRVTLPPRIPLDAAVLRDEMDKACKTLTKEAKK